jgi:prepilin peptidase CpaA
MLDSPLLSWAILTLTAGVLCYAALIDLKSFTIPNSLVIALVLLFFAYAWQSGRSASILSHVAFCLTLSLVMLVFYARGWAGGGDVKIIGAAFLWVGLECALAFAILLFFFSTAYAVVARLGWLPMRKDERSRMRIPFAPSVAAAMIGTVLAGCLLPGPPV